MQRQKRYGTYVRIHRFLLYRVNIQYTPTISCCKYPTYLLHPIGNLLNYLLYPIQKTYVLCIRCEARKLVAHWYENTIERYNRMSERVQQVGYHAMQPFFDGLGDGGQLFEGFQLF